MDNIIIYGLNITVSEDNIHIENSYTISSPKEMSTILTELKIKVAYEETPFNHRSIDSMVNEWIAHNNLYKLGFATDRTKDCDLNYPQAWYISVLYWLLSIIVL